MSELDWILLGWWAAVAATFWALRGLPRVGDAGSYRKGASLVRMPPKKGEWATR